VVRHNYIQFGIRFAHLFFNVIDWPTDLFIYLFIQIVTIFKLFRMKKADLIKNFAVCDWWQRYRLEGPVPSNWSFSACRSHFPHFKLLNPGFISIYEQDTTRFNPYATNFTYGALILDVSRSHTTTHHSR